MKMTVSANRVIVPAIIATIVVMTASITHVSATDVIYAAGAQVGTVTKYHHLRGVPVVQDEYRTAIVNDVSGVMINLKIEYDDGGSSEGQYNVSTPESTILPWYYISKNLNASDPVFAGDTTYLVNETASGYTYLGKTWTVTKLLYSNLTATWDRVTGMLLNWYYNDSNPAYTMNATLVSISSNNATGIPSFLAGVAVMATVAVLVVPIVRKYPHVE